MHDIDFERMNDGDIWIRHIEPLVGSCVGMFVRDNVNIHSYWFEALK
jgi:hypothetical protein